jgi:4-deoxy-L-threo-5-hexosulose-uronate ketol-isomerase
MTSLELREHFLLENLFQPGRLELRLVETDRMVAGGAVPEGLLELPPLREFGTGCFLERRELGVVNLGAPGVVRADEREYRLGHRDFLYVGMGTAKVSFERAGEDLPQFYLFSCPAHHAYPTTLVSAVDAIATPIGSQENASARCIRKYICPATIPSCQLTMGMTELAPGNVWNTWPPHTHSRRSEIYLYWNLGHGHVIHLMGEPGETRHLVVRDGQAVFSPPWSIHSGAGTKNYSFVWAMAGENQVFEDIDPAPAIG